MIHITELKDKYKGLPAAVLGGAASLDADLERVFARCNPVLIAVNDHALPICEPDFLVFMDRPEKYPDLQRGLAAFRGTKVSPLEGSDVCLQAVSWWNGGFSSSLATWLACYLGCDPVLLCGFDLYQNRQKHRVPRAGDETNQVFFYTLEAQLRPWIKGKKEWGLEQVRAVSGPLAGEVFPRWEPENWVYEIGGDGMPVRRKLE